MSSSSAAPRTLADQLRGWSDEQLEALLEARPDVAAPAPHDSAQLAARLVVRASVMRALDGLDTRELAVLRALAEGADPGSAAPATQAAESLDRLRALALVWGEDRPVVAVGELLRAQDDARPETAPAPPDLAVGERDQSMVDRAAAGAAFDLVRRTELLLDRWGTEPPTTLRAGGLAVRDLRAAADLMHLDHDAAALVVETAAAAGLLDQGITPRWTTTATAPGCPPRRSTRGWDAPAPSDGRCSRAPG